MNLKTFLRGIHLREEKELAEKSAIRRVLPEGEMVYPLSQHIGAPAKPVVANWWRPALRMRARLVRSDPEGPPASALLVLLFTFIGTLMSSPLSSAVIVSGRRILPASRDGFPPRH